MQHILWIGQPYFAAEVEACGFERVHVLPTADGIYAWDDIVRLGGFTPDIMVVADSGNFPVVLGMENFPCLTIFYSIYSQINSWHYHYAQGFDVCMVTQGGDVNRFHGAFLGADMIWHMPPFAAGDPAGETGTAESGMHRDCLYVDNPGDAAGAAFGAELAASIPGLDLHYYEAQGAVPPDVRLLVRVAGDCPGLDFHMFEAMSSGICLVAPRVGQGLDRMFVDGEQLVLYNHKDMGDAVYKISFLLNHPELVAYIGKTGKAEIDASHRAVNRAMSFTDHVFELAAYDPAAIVAARKEKNQAIRRESLADFYMRCASLETGWKREAFINAARGTFGLSGIGS